MPRPLLILGAGASFGSDRTVTPPLGAALFAALRRYNPEGWGQLTRELGAIFERGFEARITLSEGQHVTAPLQRAAAGVYFIRFTSYLCQLTTRLVVFR